MAQQRFHMPVGGLLAIYKGDAPLVTMCCVSCKDIVAKAGSCVDFIWDARLREDSHVDLLGLQRPTDRYQAAVPAVLDIVRGQFEARRAGFGLVLLLESQLLEFQ
jgi:hypothetical protein